jgi:hypothetical protein
MRIVSQSRLTLSATVAALLAACGGSQPPIGAPRTIPQNRTIVTLAGRRGSARAHPRPGYAAVRTSRARLE